MDIALLSRFITEHLQSIILGMTVMILISLLIFISINIKLAKLNKRYQTMMRGMEGTNLERMLTAHIDEVRRSVGEVDRLSRKCSNLEEVLRVCVQKVGIVRFNAFEDTGSDLSFAIALLDSNNNGVVLSSIFGRNDSRTYAKPIAAGQSSYFLTEEEKIALRKAQETIKINL